MLHVSLWIIVLCGYMPRSEVAGAYGSSIFSTFISYQKLLLALAIESSTRSSPCPPGGQSRSPVLNRPPQGNTEWQWCWELQRQAGGPSWPREGSQVKKQYLSVREERWARPRRADAEGSEDKDEHTECPKGRERNTEVFQKWRYVETSPGGTLRSEVRPCIFS